MHLPGHRRITKNSHQLSPTPSPLSPHLHHLHHLIAITAKPTRPLQYNLIIEQTHTICNTTYTIIISTPFRQSRIAARHQSDASRELVVLFNFPSFAIPTATCRIIRTISGSSRTTRPLAPKLICMSRQNDVTGCLAVRHPPCARQTPGLSCSLLVRANEPPSQCFACPPATMIQSRCHACYMDSADALFDFQSPLSIKPIPVALGLNHHRPLTSLH